MNTALTWRRLVLAAALVWAAGVAVQVEAGLISVLNAPLEVLLTGDDEALTQALLSQNFADVPSSHKAPSEDEFPVPKPERDINLLLEFWVARQGGLPSAPGMSSPSVVSSGGCGGGVPAAVAYWAFDNFAPPLTGRIIDRPCLILPTGPIFELLRPA